MGHRRIGAGRGVVDRAPTPDDPAPPDRAAFDTAEAGWNATILPLPHPSRSTRLPCGLITESEKRGE